MYFKNGNFNACASKSKGAPFNALLFLKSKISTPVHPKCKGTCRGTLSGHFLAKLINFNACASEGHSSTHFYIFKIKSSTRGSRAPFNALFIFATTYINSIFIFLRYFLQIFINFYFLYIKVVIFKCEGGRPRFALGSPKWSEHRQGLAFTAFSSFSGIFFGSTSNPNVGGPQSLTFLGAKPAVDWVQGLSCAC